MENFKPPKKSWAQKKWQPRHFHFRKKFTPHHFFLPAQVFFLQTLWGLYEFIPKKSSPRHSFSVKKSISFARKSVCPVIFFHPKTLRPPPPPGCPWCRPMNFAPSLTHFSYYKNHGGSNSQKLRISKESRRGMIYHHHQRNFIENSQFLKVSARVRGHLFRTSR